MQSIGKHTCPQCHGDTLRVAIVSSDISLFPDFTVSKDGKIHGQPGGDVIPLIPHHHTVDSKYLVGSFCESCSLVVIGLHDTVSKHVNED